VGLPTHILIFKLIILRKYSDKGQAPRFAMKFIPEDKRGSIGNNCLKPNMKEYRILLAFSLALYTYLLVPCFAFWFAFQPSLYIGDT